MNSFRKQTVWTGKKKYWAIPLVLFLLGAGFWSLTRKDRGIDHVFLITIDTLRADHLGCYGYLRDTTPFIDQLARHGILFKQAYSQSATTCPSHASIFTGQYPGQHRVLANGHVLADSSLTLAEILKNNKFRTAAFASTDRHFLASNMGQGFQFYEEPRDTREAYGFKYRPAEFTVDNVVIWLDNFNPREKLFVWVHLFDPHLPYRAGGKFRDLLASQMGPAKFHEYINKRGIDMNIFDNDPEVLFKKILSYDSEIRYVDGQIRRLYEFAENRGLNRNSLWIITSDHGESLGQHQWYQHALPLYQEDIHVPLLFHLSDDVKRRMNLKKGKIDQVVEIRSIFSTLLQVQGINSRGYREEGVAKSLLPLLRGDPSGQSFFAFSERQWYPKDPVPYAEDVPYWQRAWEGGEKYSIQEKGFKYIYRTMGEDEFYDLGVDPLEFHNRLNHPEYKVQQVRMKRKIDQILRGLNQYRAVKIRKVDKRTKEKLESLGYL